MGFYMQCLKEEQMPERVKIADTDKLSPGTGMVAEVNGKNLAVFNVEGIFM